MWGGVVGVTSIPAYQIQFTLNSVLISSKHYFIKSIYYDQGVFVDSNETNAYSWILMHTNVYPWILRGTNASSWISNDSNVYPW